MNIDEAIEKLSARLNCQQAIRERTCGCECTERVLFTMQGDCAESMEVDRYALAALLTIKKWKKVEIK